MTSFLLMALLAFAGALVTVSIGFAVLWLCNVLDDMGLPAPWAKKRKVRYVQTRTANVTYVFHSGRNVP